MQKEHIIEQRPEWRWWVTPKLLRDKPIHRWYVFPHSFTSELVHGLIDEWGLDENDRILDPFCGAGTTILAAKERDIPANGYDLSPLAVFVSNAKIASYSVSRLEGIWEILKESLEPSMWNGVSKTYPELVIKALPGKLLSAFDAVAMQIDALPCSKLEQDFFKLALLGVIPRYSRAIATGGWLKWVEKSEDEDTLVDGLCERVDIMLRDLHESNVSSNQSWNTHIADSRSLPESDSTYTAVITSPPYPNRHDYTRVFGVELMFAFLNWEETRNLRYQSVQSHPEARPQRPEINGYKPPEDLTRALSELGRVEVDRRIPPMLKGYFLDIYLALKEFSRVCRRGADIAVVVGNAQYYGIPFPVDELTAQIGEQCGLVCERIVAVRYRGNSAQQMGKYGFKPSRESIVVFTKALI